MPVCPACWSGLVPLDQAAVCRVCGIPGPLELTVYDCPQCLEQRQKFSLARSYGLYGGTLRELIHLLKYNGMTPLANTLGQHLAAVAMDPACREAFGHCQLVAAVPLDAARGRSRGYNQAELLARAVAARLKLPLLPAKACRRIRETPTQSGLTRAQRHENLAGAFSADRTLVAGQIVLLVDDVMTTGSTLDCCARALLAAGAAEVLALTVARTPATALS